MAIVITRPGKAPIAGNAAFRVTDLQAANCFLHSTIRLPLSSSYRTPGVSGKLFAVSSISPSLAVHPFPPALFRRAVNCFFFPRVVTCARARARARARADASGPPSLRAFQIERNRYSIERIFPCNVFEGRNGEPAGKGVRGSGHGEGGWNGGEKIMGDVRVRT